MLSRGRARVLADRRSELRDTAERRVRARARNTIPITRPSSGCPYPTSTGGGDSVVPDGNDQQPNAVLCHARGMAMRRRIFCSKRPLNSSDSTHICTILS